MLLASVLALGAGLLAGCGDAAADCPDSVVQGESCSVGAGLHCENATQTCSCESNVWQCTSIDFHDVVRDFSTVHDLSSSD
jgi:hypothetical protein